MLWDILRLAAALILIYAGIRDIRRRYKESKIEDAQAEKDYIYNTLIPFRNEIYTKHNVDAFAFVEINESPRTEFKSKDSLSSCMFVENNQIILQKISDPELVHEIPISNCTEFSPSVLQRKTSPYPMFFLYFNFNTSEDSRICFLTRNKKSWIGQDFAPLMDAHPFIDYLSNRIPRHR